MKNYLICATKTVEKNKEEQIKISCEKCGTCMLLDNIIHR